MGDIAIKVSNISKIYKLYDKPTLRVKEALSVKKKCFHKEFAALRDISFTIGKGEMLGIIGRNGAGKSTLLKIITGVLTPTSGQIEVNGKISALLELGAGFNPEYTGMENIYLNGTMMGFTHEEMEQKIDDIVTFADIGEFINQPVKTYSSGMFARLAFAVAINVEPDILIVDEALSVGDVFFQTKCYKRLDDLKDAGKTILFVTHDMSSIMKYCNRAIVINDGVIAAEGKPKDMVDIFKKIQVGQFNKEQDETPEIKVTQVNSGANWKDYMLINPNFQEYGDKRATIIDFGIFDDQGNVTDTIYKMSDFTIKMKIQFHEKIENPIFAFSIKNTKGLELTGTNTIIEQVDTGIVQKGQIVQISFTQRMILQGGQNLLQLGCTGYEGDNLAVYHRLYDICCMNIISDKTTVGYCDLDSTVELDNVTNNR